MMRTSLSVWNMSEIAKDALLDCANFALYKIVKNTNNGRNAENRMFQPYTTRYKKSRQKKGLGTRPNMQWSSSMVQSIMVDRTKLDRLQIVIKPTGSALGISNIEKMQHLERKKNYIIVQETRYLEQLIKDRFVKFVIRKWREL